MSDYCVVAALHTEWPVAGAIERQQCIQQGGVIESRGDGGCSSQSAASNSVQNLSETGIQGQTAALVLMPLRFFRSTFARSPFLAQLEHLNTAAADEIESIFSRDKVLAEKVRNALFRAAFLASAFFMETEEGLRRMHYTKELHEGLAEVAREIAHHTKDYEVREAIEAAEEAAANFVGKNLHEIRRALNAPAASY